MAERVGHSRKHSIGAAAPRLRSATQVDIGICRICRGEGTHDEPLFHPCRCSGSIQHVHQDCLMEWLSHSQKKYCELCKTSFRFTKYYDPNMPQYLSLSIFLRQTLRYMVNSIMGWMRIIFASCFWVSWLPYAMRKGWTYMFWITQESWGGLHVPKTGSGSVIELSSSPTLMSVCAASPLHAPPGTCSINAGPPTSWWDAHSLSTYMFRVYFGAFGFPLTPSTSATGSSSNATQAPINETGTLFSNVTFLNSLTPYPSFNLKLIQVLEGQVITVIVVVSFILLILVRDYVVQQQPGPADLRDEFDEEVVDQDPPQGVPQEGEQVRQEDHILPGRVDPVPEERHQPAAIHGAPEEPLAARGEPSSWERRHRTDTFGLGPGHTHTNDDSFTTPSTTERGSASEAQALTTNFNNGPLSNSWSSDQESSAVQYTPDHSEHSQSEVAEAEGSQSQGDKGKGRANENQGEPAYRPYSPTHLAEFEVGSSRPRSVSDGPQVHNAVNPLANNTWTFDTLPRDSSATGMASLSGKLPALERPGSGQFDIAPNVQSQKGGLETLPQDHPDTPVIYAPSSSSVQQPATDEPQQPPRLLDRVGQGVTGFMWGDLDDQTAAATPDSGSNGELPGSDLDDEDWVDDDDPELVDADIGLDPMADGADNAIPPDMVQEGLDAQAIEDMEDFEGIMELLGMRGPIANLIQNVIFCGVLVQTGLFACVLIPFNIGRFSIWILARPIRAVRIVYSIITVSSDIMQFAAGLISWVVCNFVDMFTAHLGKAISMPVVAARKGSWATIWAAWNRLSAEPQVPAIGVQYWSAVSRAALFEIQGHGLSIINELSTRFSMLFHLETTISTIVGSFKDVAGTLGQFFAFMSYQNLAKIPLQEPLPSVDLSLASWSGADMTWAIIAGYITILLIGAIYIRSGILFTRGTMLQEWEQGIIDSLHQLGGIIKVIFIISIEMLVFPLYCGLLLDVALLPLFADVSLSDRVLFTYEHPWTSTFVHWFVGTGYMFHFALFVSMCRKIMRTGVLFFIRDPDDPEFHPIRDVLERNLATQLRKIMFSALVYGALVIVCLGGVVWGLHWILPGVLPIYFSSNEPVLEFPVDLLFYNFLIPVVFKLSRPGDRLHAMYQWCFRKSAQLLRLTYFLFGERRLEEEGTLQLPPQSPYKKLPAYKQWFFKLDPEDGTVVQPKTWQEVLNGVEYWPGKSLNRSEKKSLRRRKAFLVETNQLVPDGYFALAPATDRIKVTKGRKIFQEVNERGRRPDGKALEGLHATDAFQVVYIPPRLVLRVLSFILCIWIFAAVTGVCLTVIPLVFGRMMFRMALPDHVHTNDIYAFCLGAHVLGGAVYLAKDLAWLLTMANIWKENLGTAVRQSGPVRWVAKYSLHFLKLIYVYSFMLVVIPLCLEAFVELYLLLPIHTIMNPPSISSVKQGDETGSSPTQHSIRIIEAWTLGLLYMQLSILAVKRAYNDSRLARAMRLVLDDGWFEPDFVLFTRAFLVPGAVIAALSLLGPPTLTWTLMLVFSSGQVDDSLAGRAYTLSKYRNSYPIVAMCFLVGRTCFMMNVGLDSLLARIRDDVYLMGERLQNYDGTRPQEDKISHGARHGVNRI